MNTGTFLLSGIIFQNGFGFGTAIDPSIGLRAIMKVQTNFSTFQGIIANGEGSMTDRWGESGISFFKSDGNGITFEKTYPGRLAIKYVFKHKAKIENIWYGAYEGEDSGKGLAKLIVTPLPEDFFHEFEAE